MDNSDSEVLTLSLHSNIVPGSCVSFLCLLQVSLTAQRYACYPFWGFQIADGCAVVKVLRAYRLKYHINEQLQRDMWSKVL